MTTDQKPTEPLPATNASVLIDYTNWKGQRRKRLITPQSLSQTSSAQHPVKQWLVKAMCHEDHRLKYFAMANIHSWVNLTVEGDKK